MRYLVAGLTVLVLSLTVFAQSSDDPFDDSDKAAKDPFSEKDPFNESSADNSSTNSKEPSKKKTPLPVRAALRKKVACDYFEQPLDDVLQQLSYKHNFQFYIDEAALEASGVNASELSVTLELENVSLETVLTLMFRRYDLAFVVRGEDEILTVTSVEAAESMLTVEVYSVHDMLNKADPNVSADMLIETIVTAVATDTWAEVGGAATISHYQGNLVVSQTGDGHRALGELLAKLRTAIQNAGGPTLPVRGQPHPVPVVGHALGGNSRRTAGGLGGGF